MGPSQFGKSGNFQFIRVAIGDCAPENSAAMKHALNARGIDHVVICDTTENLYRALDADIFDLLLYDYHLLGPRFVDVMQRIRRSEVGRNPFLSIVATIRDSSIEVVRRLIDAGVDDLFRAPATVDRILASVSKSMFRRKPFIITYDYIGPARPMGRRDKSTAIAPVRVPNTLKNRVLENAGDEDVRRIVEGAAQRMNIRQIQSCGVELDELAHRVADTYSEATAGAESPALHATLERIGAVADCLCRRAAGTPSEGVSELAATLPPIARRILNAPDGRAAVEVRLLSQLAAALRRALTVESDAVPAIREIADAVGSFVRDGVAQAPHFSVA